MESPELVNYAPALRLALLVVLVALLPVSYAWLRSRQGDRRARLAALTAVTLFLTFDLIVFGAFTRLTDSGLGCPDWPGCYGHASPVGADAHIAAAELAAPGGPVSLAKAWIEMIHRYLAATVGLLCLVICGVSWLERRQLPHSPWWPTASLVWVVIQGLFGRFTVTLKLYPLVVTLHLLGALLLLALLALQHRAFQARISPVPHLPQAGLPLLGVALAVVVTQVFLGGWVSTNYAVLACRELPTCNGAWWPTMDLAEGFSLLRELGRASDGAGLPYAALVAIQFVHRVFALVTLAVVLAVCLWLRQAAPLFARRWRSALGWLIAAQVLTGAGNVVFAWPLSLALLHSGGAAGLVLVLTFLIAHAGHAMTPMPASRPVLAA